jgi:hypothetical protein
MVHLINEDEILETPQVNKPEDNENSISFYINLKYTLNHPSFIRADQFSHFSQRTWSIDFFSSAT